MPYFESSLIAWPGTLLISYGPISNRGSSAHETLAPTALPASNRLPSPVGWLTLKLCRAFSFAQHATIAGTCSTSPRAAGREGASGTAYASISSPGQFNGKYCSAGASLALVGALLWLDMRTVHLGVCRLRTGQPGFGHFEQSCFVLRHLVGHAPTFLRVLHERFRVPHDTFPFWFMATWVGNTHRLHWFPPHGSFTRHAERAPMLCVVILGVQQEAPRVVTIGVEQGGRDVSGRPLPAVCHRLRARRA